MLDGEDAETRARPEAADLDVPETLARLGLDPASYVDLLRRFGPQAKRDLEALGAAVAARDIDGTGRLAHALAGASANLGAARLQRAARALEQAAKTGEGDLGALAEDVAREGWTVLASVTDLGGSRPRSPSPAELPIGVKDLSERRVLIVDDVRANVDLLVAALRGEYKISVALDGETALRVAEIRLPDLILLDIMMPTMDGYEVCRRLKRSPATRDIPVVFLTSLKDTEHKAKAFELGAADYVTKPFVMLEVQARVRALLRARAYQETVRELLDSELRVAREIQMGLVPHDFSRLTAGDGPDLFACLEPARAVGGDLYDVFRLDDRRLALVLGDVSGKGIPAALFMVMTLTLVRSIARLTSRPEEVLTRVNEALSADNPSSMFVTLFFAVLDCPTGRLSYASGGHLPPLLLRRGEAPRPLFAQGGPLMGALAGRTFSSAEIQLEPGDLVLAYTDGVTEALAPTGALFGADRLQALLADAGPRTGRDAVDAVLAGVRAFAGDTEQADDIAMLAIGYRVALRPARDPAELALDLHATARDVGQAHAAVREFCVARALPGPATDDLILALDEILANIIEHGYRGDAAGVIRLRVRGGAEVMELEIRDRAPAFDPLAAAPPDLSIPFSQRAIGGLGIHLARSVTDTLEYAREDGENCLRLTKRAPAPPVPGSA
jgi:serine phosphatase RsbU (regulator of sigma subunit)/anti-sigma regulatory factor (Ser/Thr protein kinase)/HPt (histidine-containing phosphotransfer) domain-containing protein